MKKLMIAVVAVAVCVWLASDMWARGGRGGGGGGGGGGRGGGGGGSRSGGGGSKANNSTPRVSGSAPKASAAANVSKPPSSAQSSYKSHPYSSRYHSSNVWMWFFFAMYIAEDDNPDEEEFEGWLEDQDEDELTAAEQQYAEEVEGC